MRYRMTCFEASVFPAPDSPEMMMDWFIPRVFPWEYSASGHFMYLEKEERRRGERETPASNEIKRSVLLRPTSKERFANNVLIAVTARTSLKVYSSHVPQGACFFARRCQLNVWRRCLPKQAEGGTLTAKEEAAQLRGQQRDSCNVTNSPPENVGAAVSVRQGRERQCPLGLQLFTLGSVEGWLHFCLSSLPYRKARSATEKTCGLASLFLSAFGRVSLAVPPRPLASPSSYETDVRGRGNACKCAVRHSSAPKEVHTIVVPASRFLGKGLCYARRVMT